MKQICRESKEEFEISDRELAFYEKASPVIGGKQLRIPPPQLSPACRERRRMAWRNERCLYVRKCDKTGAQIISMYSPDAPFPVWHGKEWWDPDFDATEFGRAVDLNRPLFEQLQELQQVVPRMHMFTYALDRMVNSDYTNCSGDLKDCYMTFCCARNERCMYSTAINDSYGCVDNFFVHKGDNCYDCIDIENCHSIVSSQSCKQCYDSYYLYDCRGCRNCIACAGLRQKEYHILNKPYSKEEFEKIKAQRFGGSFSTIKDIYRPFQQLLLEVPRRPLHGDKNENSTGDFISNTKNCVACYDVIDAEDCSYCTWFNNGKDCMDFYSWGEGELCYEVCGCGDTAYQVLFSSMATGMRQSYYTDMCNYCKNCLLCVGLRNKEYCILNKQYRKEDYEELAPKVIEQMMQAGEWGEFLPARLSSFGYNDTVAVEYYPLNRDQALALDFHWSEYQAPEPAVSQVLSASDLPDAIQDVTDDVLKAAIRCGESDKLFRVTSQELEFYRKNNLPIPRTSPDVRHRDRVARRNPRRLWQRNCAKCQTSMQTTYAPERPEVVFCEACYLDERY